MINWWIAVFVTVLGAQTHALPAPLKVTTLGKPDAPISGTFNRNLAFEPESLNPLAASDASSILVSGYVMEGLLWLNPDTYELEPELAENYEVSKDSLTYTFYLRKEAHWSDGKPVTADDVKFSIEAVQDPAFKAVSRQPYYEDVDRIEVVNPQTVRIKMKKKYFMNAIVLGTVGYTPIVPKHLYQDPKKKWDGAPLVGSGPYKVEAYNHGKNLMLVRDKNWWANEAVGLKSMGKFERVNFRFIKDESLELEMVKKGEIDLMYPVRSETFEKKAVGEPFDSKILKVRAENKIPKPWGFFAWNFKNPIFKERGVRVAMAHLLNRKLLLEKYFFGNAVEAVGPVYYKSQFVPAGLKPIEFNPEAAKALLKKAGWDDRAKTGVLQKTIAGKTVEFRFTMLLPNREFEKYLTVYKEDLKKAGIDMDIKLIEWNTFSKLLEEQKFDAVAMGWAGGSPEEDLKQIWHSESAKAGGSNFISYANKDVDKYIDQAREEMNREKRAKLWQKAVKLIAEDAPYAFLFNPKYDLFLVNKRIAFDKPTYNYDFSSMYWYLAQ